jgi:hypothetical protein
MGLVLRDFWALMGTFSGTLNAAQAYLVNDVYLKYVNHTLPTGGDCMNYLAGIAVCSGCCAWIVCKDTCVAMDRVRFVWWLCCFQYVEMALVAFQCKWVLEHAGGIVHEVTHQF